MNKNQNINQKIFQLQAENKRLTEEFNSLLSHQKDLYAKLNDIPPGISCIICLTSIRNTVIYPCKHLAVCGKCILKLTLCPICRSEIYDIDRIFMA